MFSYQNKDQPEGLLEIEKGKTDRISKQNPIRYFLIIMQIRNGLFGTIKRFFSDTEFLILEIVKPLLCLIKGSL